MRVDETRPRVQGASCKVSINSIIVYLFKCVNQCDIIHICISVICIIAVTSKLEQGSRSKPGKITYQGGEIAMELQWKDAPARGIDIVGQRQTLTVEQWKD